MRINRKFINELINLDDIAPLFFVFVLTRVLNIFILLIENRRGGIRLVEVEEEHEDRQEVIPERKKTA